MPSAGRVVAAVVVALIAALALRLHRTGAFSALPEQRGRWTQCRVHRELAASEDFVVDGSARFAYITSVDFRAVAEADMLMSGRQHSADGMYRYEVATEKLEKMELVAYAGVTFFPHGVAVLPAGGGGRDDDGQLRLYVIDHGYHACQKAGDPCQDVVLQLRVEGLQLVQERVWESEHFRSLNAVVALPDGSLYVTNDHWHRRQRALLTMVEDVVGLSWAQLVRCDAGAGESGGECSVAVDGMESGAVGVEYSAARREVYVAHALAFSIRVYDAESHRFLRSIYVGTGADNLHFDATGRLWVGAHPNLVKVPAHLLYGSVIPSQVVVLEKVGSATEPVLKQEYLVTNGDPVSGVSSALVVELRDGSKRLLLGTMADHFAVCKEA